MRNIILIAHNLRSTHNVGSLLRTAEGLGVAHVFLTGYTPYPIHKDDSRLPHESQKITKQIHKTALGAETKDFWSHNADIQTVLKNVRSKNYTVAAIEQADNSQQLPSYAPAENIALLVGREVEGIEKEILAQCDITLEIPMFGEKESFNVVQAAAMAFYHCRFRGLY